mmetsp:Transcript_24470/g.67601  ORF Transcript_24470/g.67601 Transcript_24470/m.67601 type:complete len:208 (-) Transcript_24470:397-1020(-)
MEYYLDLFLVYGCVHGYGDLDFFFVLRPAKARFLRNGSIRPCMSRLFHLGQFGRFSRRFIHGLLPGQVFRNGTSHPLCPSVIGIDAGLEINVGHPWFRFGATNKDVAIKNWRRIVSTGTSDASRAFIDGKLLQHPHLVQVNINPSVLIGIRWMHQTKSFHATLGSNRVHGRCRNLGHVDVHGFSIGSFNAASLAARSELFRSLLLKQ